MFSSEEKNTAMLASFQLSVKVLCEEVFADISSTENMITLVHSWSCLVTFGKYMKYPSKHSFSFQPLNFEVIYGDTFSQFQENVISAFYIIDENFELLNM